MKRGKHCRMLLWEIVSNRTGMKNPALFSEGHITFNKNEYMKDEKETTEENKGESIAQTPIFKKVLKLASSLALNRFRVLSLAAKAYEKLSDKKNGKKLRQEVLDRLLLFVRMSKAIITREYKHLPWASFVKVVAALLYFVMLADLIPDFVPVLGFTDDALVIAWVYNSIAEDLQRFEEWENTYAIEWDDIEER